MKDTRQVKQVWEEISQDKEEKADHNKQRL